MPTLYTSLLAHSQGNRTLAPERQRAPVPRETEELSPHRYSEHIATHYAGLLDELVGVALPARSIGIIGAGLAGLSAGYELRRRGYDVTIFEASDRCGGRTYTTHGLVKHHLMERGAELIGSNHPLWLNYADTFHLGFSDVQEYGDAPIKLGRNRLTHTQAKTLYREMGEALDFISARSKRIIDPFQPWTDPSAPAIDQQNVHDFVIQQKWSPLCKKAVLHQLESDNGVAARDQSLLGLLAMVRGGGMKRYWVDTEVYRCRRGTQALSQAFQAALVGLGTEINFCHPVTSIDASGAQVRVRTCDSQLSTAFDDVIIAIPPSAWSRIAVWMPTDLAQRVGAPPQMGKNTKALMSFRSRFWKKAKVGPSSTQNGPVDETWETTESYHEPEFGMVAFSGADDANKLSLLSEQEALNRVRSTLKNTYTHLAAQLTSSEFVNWPKREWAWASYSFPSCGDITTWGPIFNEGYAGKLHFAGEHTCFAFTGYMEAALQSGYRLARKVVLRDRNSWSKPSIVLPPPPKRPSVD